MAVGFQVVCKVGAKTLQPGHRGAGLHLSPDCLGGCASQVLHQPRLFFRPTGQVEERLIGAHSLVFCPVQEHRRLRIVQGDSPRLRNVIAFGGGSEELASSLQQLRRREFPQRLGFPFIHGRQNFHPGYLGLGSGDLRELPAQ